MYELGSISLKSLELNQLLNDDNIHKLPIMESSSLLSI